MLYKSLILSSFVASAAAANLRTPVRFEDTSRKLSYEFIAGYRPDSSVTDHVSADILFLQISWVIVCKTLSAHDFIYSLFYRMLSILIRQ